MGEAERQNPGQLARIYEAMNVLGEQAYRVNGPMLDVVLAAVAENVGTAGLPITQVGAVMEKPDRAPRFRTQASKGQVRACHGRLLMPPALPRSAESCLGRLGWIVGGGGYEEA